MRPIPGVVSEKDRKAKKDLLRTYGSTYLKEEIQAEALTRQIEGFARFFEILEDTLIVSRVDAYSGNETRRLVRHPKYYFFDNGVLNGLLKNFTLSEDRKGFLFEHFIVNQIVTANQVLGEPARLSTYRTEAGSEVDLIIERDGVVLALEIKSSTRLSTRDFSGLRGFGDLVGRKSRLVLLYSGDTAYQEGAPAEPGLARRRGRELEFAQREKRDVRDQRALSIQPTFLPNP